MNKHDEIRKELDKFLKKQEEKHSRHYIMCAMSTYVATMSAYTLENEEQILGLFDTLKTVSLKAFREKKDKL